MENLNILTLVFVVLGGIFCVIAVRILWKQKLFKYIPALLLSLTFLAVGTLAIWSGLDLLGYESIVVNKPVATVYFKRESGKRYRAHIKDYKGHEYIRELEGNYWQLDARILSLDSRLSFGMAPKFRLENFYVLNRTSNNTISVERTSQPLHPTESKIDAGQWLKKTLWLNKIFSLHTTRTMKQPLDDLAVYTISLTNLGLVAKKTSATPGLNDDSGQAK
jgi:hypothetical protein